MVLQFACLWILVGVFTTTISQEFKIVKTSSGSLKGTVEKYGDETIYQFRGIPYAKPPVGNLRFRKPVPFGPWDYTLDATKDTSPCMQPGGLGGFEIVTNTKFSEDCLFLNIHAPREVSESSNRAVMVWIHGGGMVVGQGSWYDGSYLALKGDVIVVTINYRLGMFGFLTTFDQASLGNYGLWDQRMAIEWVKSNIAAFGGNPSLITIFGESAGGSSVSYQSLSPYNKGLFQRVIVQSGTAISTPTMKESVKLQDFLAENLRCNESTLPDTFAFVECLRRVSAEELNNVSFGFIMAEASKMDFKITNGPCVDGDFIPADPEVLLDDKSSPSYDVFKSLDYMAGTTDGEGLVWIMLLYMAAEKLEINVTEGVPTRVLCDVIAQNIADTYFDNATGAAKALCEKYRVDGEGEDQLSEQAVQLTNLLGDIFFCSPTVKTLNVHNEGQNERNTFHYLFTRAFDSSFGMQNPPWFKKSGHGMELLYLFGVDAVAKLCNISVINHDYTLEDKMLKYWTNFAKYGDPNGKSLPAWTEYGEDKNYIQLDHSISMDRNLYSDRITFLQQNMKQIVDKATRSKRDKL